MEGSIGPEVGTTYNVRVKDENGDLLTESLSQSGLSFDYTNDDERTAFDTAVLGRNGVFEIAGTPTPTIPNETYVELLSPTNFWKCNESSGGLYNSITTNTGTKSGSVLYEQGKIIPNNPPTSESIGIPKASGGYFDLDDNFSFISTGSFTIGFTVKITAAPTREIMSFLATGVAATANKAISIFYDDRRLAGGNLTITTKRMRASFLKGVSGDSLSVDFLNELVNGDTVHILVTRNSGVLSFYVNGVSKSSATSNDSYFVTSDNTAAIGTKYAGVGGFVMSDLFTLNVGMSSSEVLALYNNAVKTYIAPPSGLAKRLSNPLNIELNSERDGLESYQTHKISPNRYGYSYKYKDLYKAR
jgi:hypothetical protein